MRVQSEMASEGYTISITKLCSWFGISRRTFYYKPKAKEPKIDEKKLHRIKETIEAFPTYGHRPRAKGMLSKSSIPNERWAIDMIHV